MTGLWSGRAESREPCSCLCSACLSSVAGEEGAWTAALQDHQTGQIVAAYRWGEGAPCPPSPGAWGLLISAHLPQRPRR